MPDLELILGLMLAVAVLATAARLLRIPYPILLVLGGLVLALIPAIAPVVLAPDLILIIFLPPLVYVAGFDLSPRDLRAQLGPILSLAVGLVLASTLVVGSVAHALLPEIGWPVAFAFGALLSATDALAATTLLRGIGSRRVVTLLESESVFNDATALVAYQAALGAAATAAVVSLPNLATQLAIVGVGAIPIGLLVGLGSVALRRRLNDAPVEITLSLLTPFAAYLLAVRLGVSGVLATVTAGVFVGWFAPWIMQSDTRVRSRAVWEFLVFVLNGLAFILIGLQLSTILSGHLERSLPELLQITAVIALTVILVRLAWVLVAALFKSSIRLMRRSADPPPSWRESFIVGWSGLRGVIALASALALPLATPGRGALLLVTFGVILVTLVGQGLTLPLLTRLLRLNPDELSAQQEVRARAIAAQAALARLKQLVGEWPDHLPLIDTLRMQYEHRATHLVEPGDDDRATGGNGRDAAAEQELLEHRVIRRAVLEAERNAVLKLRNSGTLTDEAWRRVEKDLDLEELRMEA